MLTCRGAALSRGRSRGCSPPAAASIHVTATATAITRGVERRPSILELGVSSVLSVSVRIWTEQRSSEVDSSDVMCYQMRDAIKGGKVGRSSLCTT